MNALRGWRDEIGDARVLAWVRIGLALMVAWHAHNRLDEWRWGYFGERFHWPWLPEWCVPSARVYLVLIVAQLGLALLALLGRAARPALLGCALIGLYTLLLDRMQFHHNRYALWLFTGLLSLTPCDRALVPFARREPTGPLWAQRLMQLQLSLIYFASGGSKLLDDDWRTGQVMLQLVTVHAKDALARGVPALLVELVARPPVARLLADGAIATELLVAVGLWSRRWRPAALWLGVMFHFSIQATSSVESFTWLTLLLYLTFVTPEARGRVARYDPARPWPARLVRALDWFWRFRLEPAPGRFTVVDRDGRAATGVAALAALARALPLLFPLWPLLALVRQIAAR
jgi:hypothetical protein